MRSQLQRTVLSLLLASCTSSPQPQPQPGPTGAAQLNDLSVMFPLPQDQAELDAALSPAAQGATGALIPAALYAAADTAGATYADLRLVAFRLDPCFAHLGPITDPSMCEAQLRLVFQTLSTASGAVLADDNAVHAFYRLDAAQLATMVTDIVVLREASTGTADLGALAPHPTIVQEGLGGDFATKLRALVLQNAGTDNLIRFTVFRSASLDAPLPTGAAGEARFWNFHGFDVAAGATTPMAIPTLPAGTPNVDFSTLATQPLYGSFQPATQATDDMQALGDYPTAMQSSAADRQRAYDAALRIENPDLHSPNTIDCASCHLAQPARQLVGETYFGLTAAGNANAYVVDASIPAAAAVSTTPALDGDTLNVHAFSYRGAAAMINQRVINETAANLVYVNQTITAP